MKRRAEPSFSTPDSTLFHCVSLEGPDMATFNNCCTLSQFVLEPALPLWVHFDPKAAFWQLLCCQSTWITQDKHICACVLVHPSNRVQSYSSVCGSAPSSFQFWIYTTNRTAQFTLSQTEAPIQFSPLSSPKIKI